MSADVFVDTNVLVYAHDLDAGEKHQKAKRLLADLWQSKPLLWVSVHVLQELLVTLRRRGGIAPTDTRETVEAFTRWRVVENKDLSNDRNYHGIRVEDPFKTT